MQMYEHNIAHFNLIIICHEDTFCLWKIGNGLSLHIQVWIFGGNIGIDSKINTMPPLVQSNMGNVAKTFCPKNGIITYHTLSTYALISVT